MKIRSINKNSDKDGLVPLSGAVSNISIIEAAAKLLQAHLCKGVKGCVTPRRFAFHQVSIDPLELSKWILRKNLEGIRLSFSGPNKLRQSSRKTSMGCLLTSLPDCLFAGLLALCNSLFINPR